MGTKPGQFWLPAGIHIDRRNRIFLVDQVNKRLQIFQYVPDSAAAKQQLNQPTDRTAARPRTAGALDR
ncbi:MAG: hypothetical protein JSV80_15510 [Acidobacteriota bacterium]|nr:MAG: hypothetical protein JSV80_15510 [Acidobacteriota bacterium]